MKSRYTSFLDSKTGLNFSKYLSFIPSTTFGKFKTFQKLSLKHPLSILSFFIPFLLFFTACKNDKTGQDNSATTAENEPALFTLLTPDKTHIDFQNTIKEGLNTNVLMYEYFYNGGGVAVGDINNDGLDDIYFTSNMESNRLYLNKGNMVFEDITTSAGVAGRGGPWKTGTTMADVNGDGFLDIYHLKNGKISFSSIKATANLLKKQQNTA
jgi:hypothetical protein